MKSRLLKEKSDGIQKGVKTHSLPHGKYGQRPSGSAAFARSAALSFVFNYVVLFATRSSARHSAISCFFLIYS